MKKLSKRIIVFHLFLTRYDMKHVLQRLAVPNDILHCSLQVELFDNNRYCFPNDPDTSSSCITTTEIHLVSSLTKGLARYADLMTTLTIFRAPIKVLCYLHNGKGQGAVV